MQLDKGKIAQILSLTKAYRPSFIGIFSSYAREEQSEDRDLDILIDFHQTVNLLYLIGIEQELSEKLNMKVDLVTRKSLSNKLSPVIFKDLKIIHEG